MGIRSGCDAVVASPAAWLERERLAVRGGKRVSSRRGSAQTDRKMFEARHTMDAPTTRVADNGAGGWYTPRKMPPDAPPGDDREPDEVRRPAVVRPVGRQGTDGAPPYATTDASRPTTDTPASHGGPAPTSPAPTAQERIPALGPSAPSPTGARPYAPVPGEAQPYSAGPRSRIPPLTRPSARSLPLLLPRLPEYSLSRGPGRAWRVRPRCCRPDSASGTAGRGGRRRCRRG